MLGIGSHESAVDALNGGRSVAQVSADNAVPVGVMHYLHPRHIYLRESGTAPLARFEHNEAYGPPLEAHTLEHGKHATLRSVEHQHAVAASGLVLDGDALGAPIFEVEAKAQQVPLHIAQRMGIAHRHCGRHMQGDAVAHHRHAFAAASYARQGVVRSEEQPFSALIFGDYFAYRCVFHSSNR